MRPRTREVLLAVACVAGVSLAGALGGLFTGSVRTWYRELVKPSFTPPSWLFGPVWTALYLMMGTSLYMLVRRLPAEPRARPALVAFGVQLALNLAWTPVFFGLHAPGAALAVIVVMWLAIAATVFLAARVSTVAAVLLVPYLLWVGFATALNAAIVALN